MNVQKVFIGGWYQRTMLHLSEIYDFLRDVESPLALDKKKLKILRDELELEEVEMRLGGFSRINIKTKTGIRIKIFEDGLIVLNINYNKLNKDIPTLTEFYEKKLSPALNYLFSLGAPVPKELANIKTIYPYFVVLDNAKDNEIYQLLNDYNQKKYFEIKEDAFEVYRGDKLYIINNKKENIDIIEKFISEQIFVREFKGQLHKYLNLHRKIWEKIADVKERGEIAGKEAVELKSKIEGYSKTINLIENRMNQMGTYVGTRADIIKSDKKLSKIADIFQFKYDTLSNTLEYMKDIWATTKNYVDSALDTFSDIQAKSTEASIKNLAVITIAGVFAGIIKLFVIEFQDFTLDGIIFFVALVAVGYFANKVLQAVAVKKKYKIKDIKINKNI